MLKITVKVGCTFKKTTLCIRVRVNHFTLKVFSVLTVTFRNIICRTIQDCLAQILILPL